MFEPEGPAARHVGIDIMKEIKDVEPSVLVINVTANGDEEVAVETFRGGLDYLKKPFSISDPLPSNTFVVYVIQSGDFKFPVSRR